MHSVVGWPASAAVGHMKVRAASAGGLALRDRENGLETGENGTTEQPGVSRRHLLISGGLIAAALLRRAEGADDQGTRSDQAAREARRTPPSAKESSAKKTMADERHPPDEPYLDGDDIQGNVLPGFCKPSMAVVALTIHDTARAKGWLADVASLITTLAEAMKSRTMVRDYRGLGPERLNMLGALPPGMNDVWLNIAVSSGGLSKLLRGGDHAGDLRLFADQGFRRGLAARSSLLGDPTDPCAEGNPANWVFGGPGREADVLLILGADREEEGARVLARVLAHAVASGLAVLYEESARKLDRIGRELFGFQDGISQPGV